MLVISPAGVEQVIDTYADFAKLVAEKFLSDENVAVSELVVVIPVNVPVLQVMHGPGESQTFPYNPLETSPGVLGEIIVPCHPDAV